MAVYPGGVYSPRAKENKSGVVYDAAKKTIVYVEDITKLDDEVVALETYLGLPAGQAGKFLIVNGTEDGLEFTDVDLSGKANIELDNLSGVAINASLVPAVDSAIDLGSSTKNWRELYIGIEISLDDDSPTSSGGPVIKFINTGYSFQGSIWQRYNTLIFSDGKVRQNSVFQFTQVSIALGRHASFTEMYSYTDSKVSLGRSDKYFNNLYIRKIYLNATGILDGATAGHILFTGDLVPATDDLEWVGQLESPFKAIKGLIIKDTTDGKHYKVEVVNGVLTTTALD